MASSTPILDVDVLALKTVTIPVEAIIMSGLMRYPPPSRKKDPFYGGRRPFSAKQVRFLQVLSVALAVWALGVATLFANAFQCQSALRQFLTVDEAVTEISHGATSFTWLTGDDVLIRSGRIPDTWLVPDQFSDRATDIAGVFGGIVTVGVDPDNTNAWFLTMQNVPPFVCGVMLTNRLAVDVISAQVNFASPSKPPIPPKAAAALCGDQQQNSIKWVIGRSSDPGPDGSERAKFGLTWSNPLER